MRQLFYGCISLFLLSCTTTHYLCSVERPTALYKNKDTKQVISYIPAGKQLIATKKGKKFRAVTFGDEEGYIVSQSFSKEIPYSQKELRHLTFNNDSTYTYKKSSTSNGSSGGTVKVKGYYRKDGTYVKPHTRSAPKRNR